MGWAGLGCVESPLPTRPGGRRPQEPRWGVPDPTSGPVVRSWAEPLEVEAKVLQVTEVPSQGFHPVSRCKPSAETISPHHSHFILGPNEAWCPCHLRQEVFLPWNLCCRGPSPGLPRTTAPRLEAESVWPEGWPCLSNLEHSRWTQGPHMSYPNGPELLLGPSLDSASGPSLTRDGQKAVICGRRKQGKTLGWGRGAHVCLKGPPQCRTGGGWEGKWWAWWVLWASLPSGTNAKEFKIRKTWPSSCYEGIFIKVRK